MPNPFESLFNNKPKEEDLQFDEWGGQFSCQSSGCNGYAKVARYFRKTKLLTWQCEDGHISRIEDMND